MKRLFAAFIVLLSAIEIPHATLRFPFLHSVFDIPPSEGITSEITALRGFFLFPHPVRVESVQLFKHRYQVVFNLFFHFESHNLTLVS